MVKDMNAMKESGQQVHQEVLELISALSDDKSSYRGSTVCNFLILFLNHSAWPCRSEVCFTTPNTGLSVCHISPTHSYIFQLQLFFVVATGT
jgi:hypothetical protein